MYLDFELDESYTPTKMTFAAGMGEYDLVEFAEWKGEQPRGWVRVGLGGCSGGRMNAGEKGTYEQYQETEEEDVLRCMCLQVRVLENHQNGKDTHIRGVQIFSRDRRVGGNGERDGGAVKEFRRDGRLGELEWMEVPELR